MSSSVLDSSMMSLNQKTLAICFVKLYINNKVRVFVDRFSHRLKRGAMAHENVQRHHVSLSR
jgi:hypothetical protein